MECLSRGPQDVVPAYLGNQGVLAAQPRPDLFLHEQLTTTHGWLCLSERIRHAEPLTQRSNERTQLNTGTL